MLNWVSRKSVQTITPLAILKASRRARLADKLGKNPTMAAPKNGNQIKLLSIVNS
jgi:hypothetical protein